MQAFRKQEGISFLLVSFKRTDEVFFLPCETIVDYYNAAKKGGRKSIPYEAFDKKYIVLNKGGYPVHYLEAVSTYLINP
jgi:recombination protein U